MASEFPESVEPGGLRNRRVTGCASRHGAGGILLDLEMRFSWTVRIPAKALRSDRNRGL
jgi:hypothetical protein